MRRVSATILGVRPQRSTLDAVSPATTAPAGVAAAPNPAAIAPISSGSRLGVMRGPHRSPSRSSIATDYHRLSNKRESVPAGGDQNAIQRLGAAAGARGRGLLRRPYETRPAGGGVGGVMFLLMTHERRRGCYRGLLASAGTAVLSDLSAVPAYPPARPTNGLAIAALVCGVGRVRHGDHLSFRRSSAGISRDGRSAGPESRATAWRSRVSSSAMSASSCSSWGCWSSAS